MRRCEVVIGGEYMVQYRRRVGRVKVLNKWEGGQLVVKDMDSGHAKTLASARLLVKRLDVPAKG